MSNALSGDTRRSQPRRVVAALLAACLWGWPAARAASAATFTLNPTRVVLSARTTSALLTLHNESDETLRFQVSAFAWTQSPSGEMQLQPTDDVVFFPALLTLKPKETRQVRVGGVSAPDAREKTYRIFVEELPPADKTTGGVRVLTKMGIPIFVRPPKEVATATLHDLRYRDGSLMFTLTNSGSVFMLPQRLTIRGMAGSNTAFEQTIDGWYVLAGSRRDYSAAVPASVCAQVTAFLVEAQFESTTLQERLQTPSGVCPR